MDSEILKARHQVLKAIRAFFYAQDFLEVETANLMNHPAPDAHIEPVRVYVADRGPFFLHTSPEIGMKKLLAEGPQKIFQICKVFRVEELEKVHNTEFTMLEWYMPGTYRDAMLFTEHLLKSVAEYGGAADEGFFKRNWHHYIMADLCLEKTGINPLVLDRQSLFGIMRDKQIFDVQGDEAWEDLFYKLFIQEVEPAIKADAPYFIEDWPLNISSMARRKDAYTVERFELYMKGFEIANGYTELFDAEEQESRFRAENTKRAALGRELLPIDTEFLAGLSRVHDSFTGVSVGVDRLLMVLRNSSEIGEVLYSRFRPA
ncbi:MAG TPA: EF-P lysine aminoacylase EpmA [Syntrophorhabdales bacterium]|nr:EF-P lysine aminoacylase EpmA [Syntrophorhabdales bacterium]